MKNYIQKKQSGGFTIIEVMIVLAVAGLIMLIVFLAVPALQRNSRNTQMRSDAASVLAGVNEFITNNNGSLPASVSANSTTGEVTITGAAGTSQASAKVRGGTTVGFSTSIASPPAGPPNIIVYTNTTCNQNTPVNTTGRAFVAVFNIESGNNSSVPQCVQS